MSGQIAIYLAGKIHKGHEISDEAYWTDEDIAEIEKCLAPAHVTLLNPAIRTDDLNDEKSVFGRDMVQVYSSDVVFVDARDRRGLGVGAEMMWARFHRIPVVTLAPPESHYNRSEANLLGVPVTNYIHPFVEGLSDAVVADIEEGCEEILKLLEDPSLIKGPEFMQEAMGYYCTTQYPQDIPMQELASLHDSLHQRIQSFE